MGLATDLEKLGSKREKPFLLSVNAGEMNTVETENAVYGPSLRQCIETPLQRSTVCAHLFGKPDTCSSAVPLFGLLVLPFMQL